MAEPTFPGRDFYETHYPGGGIKNSSLLAQVAMEGMMVTAEEYKVVISEAQKVYTETLRAKYEDECFKSTQARSDLWGATHTVRERIAETYPYITDRWVQHVDPVSPNWVLNTIKGMITRAQSNLKRATKNALPVKPPVSKTLAPASKGDRPSKPESESAETGSRPLPDENSIFFIPNRRILVEGKPPNAHEPFEDFLAQYILDEYKHVSPHAREAYFFDFAALVEALIEENKFERGRDLLFYYKTEHDRANSINQKPCKTARQFRIALGDMARMDIRFYTQTIVDFESGVPIAPTSPKVRPGYMSDDLYQASPRNKRLKRHDVGRDGINSPGQGTVHTNAGTVSNYTPRSKVADSNSQAPPVSHPPINPRAVGPTRSNIAKPHSQVPQDAQPSDDPARSNIAKPHSQVPQDAQPSDDPAMSNVANPHSQVSPNEALSAFPGTANDSRAATSDHQDVRSQLGDGATGHKPSGQNKTYKTTSHAVAGDKRPNPSPDRDETNSDDEPIRKRLRSNRMVRKDNSNARLDNGYAVSGNSGSSNMAGIGSSDIGIDDDEIDPAPEEIDEGRLLESAEARELRIQQLSVAPSLNQLTDSDWTDCATFFKFNKDRRRHSDTIWLPRLKISLYPHQVYCIYWMLNVEGRNPNLRGGFIADEVGVGKTFEMLGYWVMNTMLVHLRRRIKANQLRRGNHHLLAGTVEEPQPKYAVCPSASRIPIQCPCIENSIAHGLAKRARAGPCLGVIPPQLMHQWASEADRLIDFDGNFCRENGRKDLTGLPELHMFVAHGTNKAPADDFVVTHLKAKLEREPDRDRPGRYLPIEYVNYRGSERILVLTTPLSLQGHVLKPYSTRLRSFWTSQNKERKTPKVEDHMSHALAWGIMFRDEFHKDKGLTTKVSEYFRQAYVHSHSSSGSHPLNPIKWALSGTPFDTTPMDLLSHIQALETPEWSSRSHPLRGCTGSSLENLGVRWSQIVPKDITSAKAAVITINEYARSLNQLLQPLMIRRMGYDMFWDERIVQLDKCIVHSVRFKTPLDYAYAVGKIAEETEQEIEAEFQRQLRQWNKGAQRTPRPQRQNVRAINGDAHFRYRICATFPAFADLYVDNPEMDFKKETIDRLGLLQNPDEMEASVYSKELERLTVNAPKLRWIRDYLENIHRINTAPGRDGSVSREKVVIFSNSPAIAMVINLWLNREMPAIGAVLYHQKLTLDERYRLVRSWSSTDETTAEDKEAYRATVLVSTLVLAGVGLNLIAANHAIITDLAYTASHQKQGFGRIHRSGQTRKTNCYLLWTTDNKPEANIKARQDGRSDVQEETLRINTLQARMTELEEADRERQRVRAQTRRLEQASRREREFYNNNDMV